MKKHGKRLIILMDNYSKSNITKVQNELQVKLTSSAELSGNVGRNDVLEIDKGLYFKNIGVAVVEDIEPEHLKFAKSKNSGIIYWEEERTFTNKQTSIEQYLKDIKQQLDALKNNFEKIEELIKGENLIAIPEPVNSATWGLERMKVTTSKYTGKGVNLCVLDSGLYLDHPDFKGRNIIGKSFIPGQAWDYDGDGHGTHCAGTAAGYYTLEDGMRYGVAYEANLLIGKVLNDKGNGTTSSVIDGVDWALEKEAQIISMSLSAPVKLGEKPSLIFEMIGTKAIEHNALIIAAAGNDSNRPNMPKPVGSPANADSIMAVGAINSNNTIANFSNGGINAATGGKVDIVAPGVNIFSSFSKNSSLGKIYNNINGTSMATPHIAGLAALYLEKHPNLTALELWEKLESTATKLDDVLMRDYGNGIGCLK